MESSASCVSRGLTYPWRSVESVEKRGVVLGRAAVQSRRGTGYGRDTAKSRGYTPIFRRSDVEMCGIVQLH
jgi:hypothetical protein